MTNEANSLSIVCGTYNRRDQLERLVNSVIRETRIPYHLYITDAGSTDGTVEYLRSVTSDRIHPVFVGKRLGQARAYNDVFMRVKTPYVCWVSDDNEIVDQGLDKAVEILKRERRIGMVGLKVRDMIGPFVKAPYIGGVSSIGILNVNQGVLPTEVLHALGGFSEDFRDYGIDPDLTAKVLFLGFDVVYTRDVAIHHFRNWSEDKESPEYKTLQEKHDRFRKLYEETYQPYSQSSWLWSKKKQIWEWARGRFASKLDLNVNSEKPVFGNLPRDYYNTVMAKHISLADPLFSFGKPYHLRQRYRGKRPPVQLI
ncbi:glycosyltransferase [Hyphomonas sp.]|uniref:glycosyltransferase family 2 protein n=1 Tax=Hyphomonas sp. TaxID=87 RepID=UPI001BCFA363|nr:glycosyltransferase [Hyphomonas sp.]